MKGFEMKEYVYSKLDASLKYSQVSIDWLEVEERIYFVLLVLVSPFLSFVPRGVGKIFSLLVAIFLVLEAIKPILSVFSNKAWEQDDLNISDSRFVSI